MKNDLRLLKKDLAEYISKRCSSALAGDAEFKKLSINFEKLANEECVEITMELVDRAAIIAYTQCLKDLPMLYK